MHVLADLCARTDRCPGIDHRALVDVGTDVDVTRHQHDVAADERAAPGGGRWHDAEAAAREPLGVVVGKLVRHLVVIAHRAAVEHAVFLQAEREQHRLLEPLMRHPLAVDLLGDAQAAAIELLDGVGNGLCHGGRGRIGLQRVAVLPRLVDDLLDVVHVCLPELPMIQK
ncbi:MAG: hypothetical protein AW07_04307 [Candidatus Accumulibacter sp. SK-11]|nr:MAG: hypothetical protein AW07_04307 [Candidatus Accumulibacter sp. SK-11]